MPRASGDDRPRRRGRRPGCDCPYCGNASEFCWRCPCGFAICPACMEENLWGMTCNQIIWTCPDCGRQRPFGNQ